jgi:hypothetical protein
MYVAVSTYIITIHLVTLLNTSIIDVKCQEAFCNKPWLRCGCRIALIHLIMPCRVFFSDELPVQVTVITSLIVMLLLYIGSSSTIASHFAL